MISTFDGELAYVLREIPRRTEQNYAVEDNAG